MVNTLSVNVDHGCEFHPLADHMTKIQNFAKGEIRKFLAFLFSLQLMFGQTLSNLIVCLVILQKLDTKVAQIS